MGLLRSGMLLLSLCCAVVMADEEGNQAAGLRFTLNRMLPLIVGHDALVARLDIVEHAEKTIDLQYYIYHNDRAGRLLAHALLRAADRGVRVRALIDDIHGADDGLVDAMNAHPNIELRHFNPFHMRKLRMLEAMLFFNRVDRRMHNKQLTVDGLFSIVGGRNIGDEYFGTSEESDFADIDVLVSGPVVPELEAVFEEYWQSPRTRLLSRSAEAEKENELLLLRQALAVQLRDDEQKLLPLLLDAPYVKARQEGRYVYAECPTAVLADSPEEKDESNSRQHSPSTHVGENLVRYLRGTKSDVLLMSAYFVPGKQGAQELIALRQRGVNVAVLTNSLASTDVSAVHAGYSRYRQPLLAAGARLWEMKPVQGVGKKPRFSLGGSSRASLHTKAYVFDERYFFVGSFNMDPRSAVLNTEMGLLFDCPEVALKLRAGAEEALPDIAYRVYLDDQGRMRWESGEETSVAIFEKEPNAGFWRRSLVWWLRLLPIEGEL